MDDDGVEVEDFGVSDYDIENALNPGRPRRRASKNQQIYGIWADDSEEEDVRPSFGSKGFSSGPVNFVSGGIKQSGGDKPEKVSAEKEVIEISDDEDDKALRNLAYKKYQSKNRFKGSAHEGIKREVAGLRGANDQDFGSWEKHTKGIGQKLLLQMGYQPGKGLGKALQGISAPVEAKKRPGKGAIGMYGSERTKQSLKDFPQKPTDEQEEKQFREKLQQWKKMPGDETKKKKNVNYVYRTADDVKSDGTYRKLLKMSGSDGGSACRDKIIDMTGPQQRVLSGYKTFKHKHMCPDVEASDTTTIMPQKDVFEMNALLYNIDMLVDMSEQEIIKNDKDLQYHNDLIINHSHQEETMDKVIENEKRQIRALEKILEIIHGVEENDDADVHEILAKVANVLHTLQHDYYEEYKLFALSDLAVPLVFPLIKKEIQNWEPLENRDEHLNLFKDWKDILEENLSIHDLSEHKDGQLCDRYHRLIWDVWMPLVRKVITNKWAARDCDPLISFLETWMPLLPQWIFSNILDQLVMPRLQVEVDKWNPLTDTVPIHSWLHPWLPLMGERLEPLYAPIRQKLGSALVCWHPNDQSAKLILQPWVSVFSKGTMQAFVVKNILPKLVVVVQKFVINPHQQHLEPWHWVMAWEEFLPLNSLVNLLDKNFFPRWIQVLCTWLNSNPDYSEVSNWYQGWKSMFSNNLLNDPTIKGHFKRALEFLNRAISNPQQNNFNPSHERNQPPVSNQNFYQSRDNGNEAPRNFNNFSNNMGRRAAASASLRNTGYDMSFKEMVAVKADENQLLFAPIPKRFYDGKQVYRFGRLIIHFDQTAVLYFKHDVWMPTSLNNLVMLGS